MNSYTNEQGYIDLLKNTLTSGEQKETRNGNVISTFGQTISFNNINTAFPLLTTKKVFTKGVVEELLWFLRGSTNAKELQEKGVNIWNGNSTREYLDSVGLTHYEEGELGPVYGWQWRSFGKSYKNKDTDGFDQIKYLLEELSKPSFSRRAVLSSWNPQQLQEMALPPCHILYTFYKDSNGLSCMMNMRSSDLFLGLPFNIASTAILTHIIAKVLHIEPYRIMIAITDAHIYQEHLEAVQTQMKNPILPQPIMKITKEAPDSTASIDEKINWINSLRYEDFTFENYQSAGPIKAPMK
jgi:dihydrofolate reductase/thymidylate synthase